ncbi:MAG TPA: HAD-IA family hydrolase [Thermoanaerobaculia bacterium]|nr:HAD-IA family hydrolase [Thermoanaerobaculia bacterium]
MKPPRLLVFDWDGTLMDSVGTIVACTQAVIRELELGELPEEKVRGTIGLGLRETIELLIPGCDDALFESIIESYRRHWWGTFRDRPVLFPGVGEMLRGFAEEGYLLAVATGKSRRGLDHSLEQTGLLDLFHSTRTVDEALSKPHPQMLLDILDDLGVRPAEAVMIGDTTFDLEMARSAGTGGIGVCSGSHCREELQRLEPLACLETVVDLPAWLAATREPAVR